LDLNRDGKITFEELRSMLQQYGVFPTEIDMQNIMKRFDKDKDGVISYTEFAEEMTPKSPSKY